LCPISLFLTNGSQYLFTLKVFTFGNYFRMKKLFFIYLFLLLLTRNFVSGQLSKGGLPLPLPPYKKAVLSVERMPSVVNEMLRLQYQQEREKPGALKPFTFAHAFQVNISPLTHGTWLQAGNGTWIWLVSIRSEGALSLNLLFEQFRLPEYARLFIYTPGQDHILGAFTKENNSPEGVFLVAPLPGDELTIQYETKQPPEESGDFIISRVNHDFTGILKYTDKRRPMGSPAGACNQDIHCNSSSGLKDVRNSVCRIMVLGTDLCTGTLVNNTRQDGKPFILTANHCIDTTLKAPASLFLFNYESPYCGALDGDVTNSLSGSKLKAHLFELDFSLVELNTPPPPSFRPYFSGWTRSTQTTDTVSCIHHPYGDIKKIAVDYNIPLISTFEIMKLFTKNGFWKVLKWDIGTTEIGSSGGPLFTRDGLLMGSLSGGDALCANPVNDFFTRFDLAWDQNPDSAKQLKHWLDPAKKGATTLKGMQFNEGADLCGAFTNLEKGDTHQLLRIQKPNGGNGGYWSGSNSEGITEVAEMFTIPGKEKLFGVSVGLGRKYQRVNNNFSYLTVKVYNVINKTATLLATRDTVYLKNLTQDAMNMIKFNNAIEPADTFLVAFNLEHVIAVDSIAIYHALRATGKNNSFLVKRNGTFTPFVAEYQKNASALALEVIACNIGNNGNDTLVDDKTSQIVVFPNPTHSKVRIQSKFDVSEKQVAVFNILGQEIRCNIVKVSPRTFDIGLSGNKPGIYLLRVRHGNESILKKIILVQSE